MIHPYYSRKNPVYLMFRTGKFDDLCEKRLQDTQKSDILKSEMGDGVWRHNIIGNN
jgi:hypothetical protein